MNNTKKYNATYKCQSFNHEFVGGSNTECKKSIIWSMKEKFGHDINVKEIKIKMM